MVPKLQKCPRRRSVRSSLSAIDARNRGVFRTNIYLGISKNWRANRHEAGLLNEPVRLPAVDRDVHIRGSWTPRFSRDSQAFPVVAPACGPHFPDCNRGLTLFILLVRELNSSEWRWQGRRRGVFYSSEIGADALSTWYTTNTIINMVTDTKMKAATNKKCQRMQSSVR
jgi:hypothetical protein